MNKLKEYTQKIHICNDRNSYSKTDKDAMKNGQLKPAYNLQHGVDSEYNETEEYYGKVKPMFWQKASCYHWLTT
ncbi:hypothetical protein [Clostridium sp. 19966]|uniref:hypothetical protein n=1 Tax=Clostridium sp. 19966 TaxID=2768166 RepID=UPI0028EA32A3|nr:hypothetical protein [Clostridium sp. 19966]